MKDKSLRAFTLIELLIVIAIIAILGAALILVLNPVELMAQARDSQRITDTGSVNDSVRLYSMDNSGSLGSSNVVYISIPDTSSTCANITGLPTLPSGWSYHCSAPADFRRVDSFGWLPLNLGLVKSGSPLAALPIDPINNVNNFYQYVASNRDYSLKVPLESVRYQPAGSNDGGVSTQYEKGNNLSAAPLTTSDNWIKVPGNAAFGTTDFWTMKYEAKCVSLINNQSQVSPTLAGMYRNDTTACTTANNRYVASVPLGYPISFISHDTAKTYCQSMGARLMTNEEYMTLARNVESVGSNWTGGAVADGALYSGNASVLVDTQAGPDSNGYYGVSVTSGISRRTHTLSNGAVIWDLAGNVFEHVMRTISDDKTVITIPTCTSMPASFYTCEYGTAKSPYITNYGSIPFATIGSSNAAWNSDQGVGQILTDGSGSRPAGTVLVRGGGAYNSTASVGIYSVFTNQSATASNDIQIGFRCVR